MSSCRSQLAMMKYKKVAKFILFEACYDDRCHEVLKIGFFGNGGNAQ